MYSLLESFRSALTSIRAHALRSILTALGIIIGVASVIAVISIVQGLSHSITKSFAGLGSNSLTVQSYTSFDDQLQGRTNRLNYSDYEQLLHRLDDVRDVSPVLSVFGSFGTDVKMAGQTAFTRVFASSPVYQDTRQLYPSAGRFLTKSDEQYRRRVCVIGSKVQENMKANESLIGRFIEISGEWFKVIGVMEERGEMFGISQDDYIIIPFSTGMTLLPEDEEPDISITFNVNKIEKTDEVRDRVTEILRQRHRLKPGQPDDFKVETAEQLMKSFSGVLDTVTLVFSGIVGISLLVGGIGIMNIMLVSVTERTKEIGILKALGARRVDILLQFLVEAALLSMLGGAIGLLVGYLIGVGVAQIIPSFPPAVVPWWAAVLAFGFSAFVGIVFGIIPAAKAAALDPIVALRHE